MGHSGPSAMFPFDRVHTTSFSSLIETVHLSCIANASFCLGSHFFWMRQCPQGKVSCCQILFFVVLLYASETWTLLASPYQLDTFTDRSHSNCFMPTSLSMQLFIL